MGPMAPSKSRETRAYEYRHSNRCTPSALEPSNSKSPCATINPLKRVITSQDIPAGGELRVPAGRIVTASAREVAAARGVRILELPEDQMSAWRRRKRRSPSAPITAASA